MSLTWSFSSERNFRRCQRQFYFREIMASHNARNSRRREAFLLKQLKSLEQWRGNLIHLGMERFVVPALESGTEVNWDAALRSVLAIGRQQFNFSSARRYREPGLSKSQAGDAYCALWRHEIGETVPQGDVEAVEQAVESAFRNLANLNDFLGYLRNRAPYRAEQRLHIPYHDGQVVAVIDLLCFRGFGQPIVVEWKAYELASGSDAQMQTALYAWALCRSNTWKVSDPAEVELFEVQLLTPEVVQHRCTATLVEELEDRVYRSLTEIRDLCGEGRFEECELEDFDFAGNSNSCRYCNFRSLCLAQPPHAEPPEELALAQVQGTLF